MKMDRIINTKTEQQSIYEIYRACRLCGAGAGYKMPIVQNVVDFENSGVELTQKIRECVQIEVHPDDKMPPLICELCVDKVNDFYEFAELCQRTNKRTRMRLGLPPQTTTRVASSDASSISGDCILGVTEPVYQNEDSDEPLAPTTRRPKQSEDKHKVIKKEKQTSKENSKQASKQNSKQNSKLKRPPTPPRTTRLSRGNEDTVTLSKLKQQQTKKAPKETSSPPPKSILKREKMKREETPPPAKSKRPREPPKPEVPPKRVKLSLSSSKVPPSPRPRRPPAAPAAPARPPAPAPPQHPCRICGKVNSTSQALANHHRSHTVQHTSEKLACNACELWFPTLDEAHAHHKWHSERHKPYTCRRCSGLYDTFEEYNGHFAKECEPWEAVPDIQCPECWKMFATNTLLCQHRCGGPAQRAGGKCSKCRRVYSLHKNLIKHEASCNYKRKGSSAEPDMRPQVRVARCDPLLSGATRCDATRVGQNYGLDRKCYYPYISRYVIKSELPKDSMVRIKAELDDFEEQDFVHWDSGSESEEEQKTVDSLATLSLKRIFSKTCMGKVPRKRRRVKLENNAFDSLIASEFDSGMGIDINNIIDNLGKDNWDDASDKRNDGSDEESLLTNYVTFDNDNVNNKVTAEDNSDDSQSILDKNAECSIGKERDGNTGDNMLDEDSSARSEETKEVSESERVNEQEMSKETSNVNNDESETIKNKGDISEHSNESDARTRRNTENNSDATQSPMKPHEGSRTKLNESLNIDNNYVSADTKNDAEDKEIETNDSESASNDSESSKNGNDKVNDSSIEKVLNGDVNNKTDKVNNSSDQADVLEALDEHIGENHTGSKDVNGIKSIENNINNEERVSNDISAKIESSNACEDMTVANNINSNNRISQNNDIVDDNVDEINNDAVPQINDLSDNEKRVSYIDTDKILLEDLLPRPVAESADLDSISDDDFNFDAC